MDSEKLCEYYTLSKLALTESALWPVIVISEFPEFRVLAFRAIAK